MIAKIKPLKLYTIELDGTVYVDCEKVSEWNSMAEFRTPSGGTIIIDLGDNISQVLSRLFGEDAPAAGPVVKASLDILGGAA
jgi:hypothetical protein